MRTFPLNSYPGHFSRVRQSKNFLISRPCVSCPNNRIFSLRIVNSFLWLFFHTFRPRPHVSGYFWKGRFLCPLSKKKTLPLFLDKTEARRAQKNSLETAPPLSQGLDDCPPYLSDGLNPPLSWPNMWGNWSRFQTDTCGRGLRKKLYKKIHKKEIYIRRNQSTLQVSC